MKGQVAFWFRIRRQGDQVLCEALFKLFGQKCSICNQPDSFNEVIINFSLSCSVISHKFGFYLV